jgi:hypothetical protein
LDSGATAKELLQAFGEARITRNMKILAERVAAEVEQPECPPFSGEAWDRSNLAHMIRKQRYGKDDGARTPPISLSLDGHITESDVAALVAAPAPSDVSVASPSARFTSQASGPIHGLATVDLATGNAHRAFQPPPGYAMHHDQASV